MNYQYFSKDYGDEHGFVEYYRLPIEAKTCDKDTVYEYYSKRQKIWDKGSGRILFGRGYKQLTEKEYFLEMI
jgi:hypothetical protein